MRVVITTADGRVLTYEIPTPTAWLDPGPFKKMSPVLPKRKARR